jgi:hypothetical protein
MSRMMWYFAPQRVARLADYDVARLVPGVALRVIRDVIVADHIAFLELDVALAAVVHHVAARGEDAVHPARAAAQAARDDLAVHLALGVSGAHGGEHFEIRIVEQVRRAAQQLDLGRRLDPAHFVHHLGAVEERRLRQQFRHLLHVRRADIGLSRCRSARAPGRLP